MEHKVIIAEQKMNLLELKEKDYPVIKEIYDYYILNSTTTFHTERITISELKEVVRVDHPRYKSYLIEYEGNICGFIYTAQYKKRPAYDRTAEISIYLKDGCCGRGIGKTAMEEFEKILMQTDTRVLVGSISGENTASIHLFEKCGYEKCAHIKKVGEKFGRLLDVVIYQKVLSE